MNPPSSEFTQAALLTPLGPAGITVVQLIGPGAAQVLEPLLRDARGRKIQLHDDKTDSIVHACMIDQTDQRIDEVILCLMRSGEQTCQAIDICCHGGVRPGQKIMEVLSAAGVRAVQAGDLPGGGFAGFLEISGGAYRGIAAEVFTSLGQARTPTVVRILLEQLQGGLSAELQRLLSENISNLQLAQAIDRLLATWMWGRHLSTPVAIALAGPANAGKSSLANVLSGRQASIVTSKPGTTRDWVTHDGSLAGLPVVLIDTAGHRHPADALEAEAIRRATRQSRRADVQLLVIDGTSLDSHLPELPPDSTIVVALNKADLPGFSPRALPRQLTGYPCVKTSAITGLGLEELTLALLKALASEQFDRGGAVVFTERQNKCLQFARSLLAEEKDNSLRQAKNALRQCLLIQA